MADEAELREQLLAAFEGVDYPVESPMDLLPALPDGINTRFESGDFAMTAVELNTKLPSPEFPYDSAEALVDDIVAALEDEGYL